MDREPVIVLDIHGLKCDAGCGWSDMSVPLEDYPRYINAACPRCGSSVLTPADFKAVYRTVRMVNWINRWLWWLPRKKGPWVERNYDLDGTGRVFPVELSANSPSGEAVSADNRATDEHQ